MSLLWPPLQQRQHKLSDVPGAASAASAKHAPCQAFKACLQRLFEPAPLALSHRHLQWPAHSNLGLQAPGCIMRASAAASARSAACQLAGSATRCVLLCLLPGLLRALGCGGGPDAGGSAARGRGSSRSSCALTPTLRWIPTSASGLLPGRSDAAYRITSCPTMAQVCGSAEAPWLKFHAGCAVSRSQRAPANSADRRGRMLL